MTSARTRKKTPVRKKTRSEASILAALDARLRRSWTLLSVLVNVSTGGLCLALLFATWPWTLGEVASLLGVIIAVWLGAGHLAYEGRNTLEMRRQLQRAEKSTDKQRYQRLYELLTLTRLLDSEGDPESIFKTVSQVCLNIFDCEKASLMLFDAAGWLEVKSTAGYSEKNTIGAKQKLGDGIAGWVANQRKPIVLQGDTDVQKYPGLTFQIRNVAAAIVVPVVLNDKLIGVLNISTRNPDAHYDKDDLRALESFAANIAVVVGQATRARHMNDTIEQQQDALQKMHASTT